MRKNESESGIPKVIHYCWFGKGKKPKLVEKCILSWKKVLPEYSIIEWNEENFDINCNTFVSQAYKAKKYAFVSDYARLCALEKMGGVYLDTDEEIIRNFTELLIGKSLVACFESNDNVMVGLLAVEPNNKLIVQFREYYEDKEFLDESGKPIYIPNPVVFTELLCQYGLIKNGQYQELKDRIVIYPLEYFCARNPEDLKYTIGVNTYGVQYYSGSWLSPYVRFKWKVRKVIARIFGEAVYKKSVQIVGAVKRSFKHDKGTDKRDTL